MRILALAVLLSGCVTVPPSTESVRLLEFGESVLISRRQADMYQCADPSRGLVCDGISKLQCYCN